VAKKKGATGRARGSGKTVAKKKAEPQAEQKAAGGEVGTVEGPEADNRAILDGAELQRLMKQAAAEGGTQPLAAHGEERSADRERMGRIEAAIAAMGIRLGEIATQRRETAAAPTTAPVAATTSDPTARLVSETRSFTVDAWRQSLWISETNQSKPLPKPRTTIVGRALSDLGATSRNCDEVTILEVFRLIRASGRHHLDQNVLWNLESATSSEKIERDRANSRLTKIFNKRFERLKKAHLADEEADRRWLIAVGKDIFNGWPDWQVEHDDEECEGTARLARRRPEAAVAQSGDVHDHPAASAEGGSFSGTSE
jgi:hypothetical protein